MLKNVLYLGSNVVSLVKTTVSFIQEYYLTPGNGTYFTQNLDKLPTSQIYKYCIYCFGLEVLEKNYYFIKPLNPTCTLLKVSFLIVFIGILNR